MPKVALGQYSKQNELMVKTIKKCMIDKDMNAKKVSAMIGKCETTHNNYMNEPEKITVESLRRYIRALRIPQEDIIAALYSEDF